MKNIYYSWRKEKQLYKKASIFIFTKTIDETEYLKDYNYTYLYNETSKSLFYINILYIVLHILLKN